jgi:ribulose-phosphate 3-epimerase
MSFVVPAVLPASRKDLTDKLALIASLPLVDRVQIDVVDGKFATPASWPYSAPTELNDMLAQSEMLPHLDRLSYEIDLMCFDAVQAAAAWLNLGATRLTFHAESTTNLPRLFASVRDQYGDFVSFGLALNIASDLELIEQSIDTIEYVQCMGIARVGRQGQPFDERVFEKIRVFHYRHPDIPLQVDGGVSLLNAQKLVDAGVSNLVVGSSILRARDPASTIKAFGAFERSFGV